ncbi:hypothetical protein AAY473_017203 [Plecturocebus cupreus]
MKGDESSKLGAPRECLLKVTRPSPASLPKIPTSENILRISFSPGAFVASSPSLTSTVISGFCPPPELSFPSLMCSKTLPHRHRALRFYTTCRLEYDGTTTAHCNLELLDSSDLLPVFSVAGTTSRGHQASLFFPQRQESRYVAQTGLKLLVSRDPTLASQSCGITESQVDNVMYT